MLSILPDSDSAVYEKFTELVFHVLKPLLNNDLIIETSRRKFALFYAN